MDQLQRRWGVGLEETWVMGDGEERGRTAGLPLSTRALFFEILFDMNSINDGPGVITGRTARAL